MIIEEKGSDDICWHDWSSSIAAARRITPDDSCSQIQQWPDERLEAVHDFIQWLFPLPEPSPVNPLAPVLDRETVEAFAARPELRENLRVSFLRMLRFYGLEMQPGPPPAFGWPRIFRSAPRTGCIPATTTICASRGFSNRWRCSA